MELSARVTKRERQMGSCGFVLTVDAILSLAFMAVVLVALLHTGYTNRQTTTSSFLNIHYLAEDTLTSLNQRGVLDEIGMRYSQGNLTEASRIAESWLNALLPDKIGYRMLFEGIVLAEGGAVEESIALAETHASRMLVGYGENVTLLGNAARSFLTGISNKNSAAYAYFGGFEGQGDLTKYLYVPTDAKITGAYVELNAGGPFELSVNGRPCRSFLPANGEIDANVKSNISDCNFATGKNVIELGFGGSDWSKRYVGGGFIKVEYNSGLMDEPVLDKYEFPGIDGLINLFSSFYVPGDLKNMSIYLHFRSNFSTFLNIGGVDVFSGDNPTEQAIMISNQTLSQLLDYNSLSRTTIPIRMGIQNLSVQNRTPLDIILVNDRSGSMRQSGWVLLAKGAPSNTFTLSVPRSDWSSSYSFNVPSGTSALAVNITWAGRAGYPGSEASEFILNLRRPNGNWIISRSDPGSAGGKVDPPDAIGASNEFYSGISTKPQAILVENPQAGQWQVSVYGWNFRPKSRPPSTIDVKVGVYIDRRDQTGDELNKSDTVLANQAAMAVSIDFVNQTYPEDFVGFVKFGSYAVLGSRLTQNKTAVISAIRNTGIEGGTAINTGIDMAVSEFRARRRHDTVPIMILMTDGQNDEGYVIVNESCNNAKAQGIVIYTVGMTAFVDEKSLRQCASTPDKYYYAPTAADLAPIYKNISNAIMAQYRAQTISVNASSLNLSSILYPDSYIRFDYRPVVQRLQYGDVVVTYNTERFNDPVGCTGKIVLPKGVTVLDAKATSYSSRHWTNYLQVSNSDGTRTQFALSNFGFDYSRLGDPFVVQILPTSLKAGETNTIRLTTADSPLNESGCSADNRAILTVKMNGGASYGDVFPIADGCNWFIEFEDGTSMSSPLPLSYLGGGQCWYTPGNVTYQKNDAVDDAVYRMLSSMDIDQDGRVDITFDPTQLAIEATNAGSIKSLWGPATATLVLWM